MFKKLKTLSVNNPEEIKSFFDDQAINFAEQHGNPEKLLKYRTKLLRNWCRFKNSDIVLDIGCGIGHHLIGLADNFKTGIGIDFSAGMIKNAEKKARNSQWKKKLHFNVDNAETLYTIADNSVDKVICVGAFEHMLNRLAVLKSIHRVLKNGGRFVCLTPNGSYAWYHSLAPLLRFETRHLSTDRFLTPQEISPVLRQAGFDVIKIGYWTFIPKGDMTVLLSRFLYFLDWVGRIFRIKQLRGGLVIIAG